MTKIYFLLKEQIIKLISNSGLNVGAVYYILKDILRDVELQYISQVNKELSEEATQMQEEENKEDNLNS